MWLFVSLVPSLSGKTGYEASCLYEVRIVHACCTNAFFPSDWDIRCNYVNFRGGWSQSKLMHVHNLSLQYHSLTVCTVWAWGCCIPIYSFSARKCLQRITATDVLAMFYWRISRVVSCEWCTDTLGSNCLLRINLNGCLAQVRRSRKGSRILEQAWAGVLETARQAVIKPSSTTSIYLVITVS